MNAKRLYFALLILVGILILGLIGGAYGLDKLLHQQSKQLLQDKTQAAVLTQEETTLVQAKKDIAKYQTLAVIAKSVVPQDKDQAETVRQIVSIASANGISLGSITFPTSTLGLSTGKTSAVSSSTPSLSQLAPVAGISGVYSLTLTVASDSAFPVHYSSFINFLQGLEHNRRTAQVNSITLQPDQKDRSLLSFTLVLNEFIKS